MAGTHASGVLLEIGKKMKVVILIARLLLGLIFFVLGLNGFLNFLSMGPMPTGLAGQFIGALFQSHYLWVVAGLQVVGGLLLLVNRFVPLALVLLGPVIVNILLYHLLMSPAGYRDGNSCDHPVVHSLLRTSPILFRHICAASVKTLSYTPGFSPVLAWQHRFNGF